jgi:murein L,D-transpeptidase YcbB/YkuD
MKKYRIVVECYCPFELVVYKSTVTAYLDTDGNTLWYDDVYGLECMTYLTEHPEAVSI